ncbi:F-box/kelch-repeat protein At3g16740 [Arabidopsis lyrata subsp. lyrata]|uniref:F-box/kelch-repeat protein At3g16740 n=1 Tax=Arabidopsis lyrata subsp. lyrata TaxID=81972 RepID=UPI000A29C561|nr:F-box/kelch-repeat protein At3g16740 [Arabidopsis lyrata subsp. lyrata]|eukprot:XP_020886646.1 F-box/kelch-repeat protein At3g16740 [Arabidopsis lyrata subsp. lyrata]
MAMSDVTQDLVEDVISRVPLTSRRSVRSTCKNWNTLSKNLSFRKINLAKARAETKQEFPAIMILEYKVYLMSFDLRGIHNDDEDVESSIKREAVCCYASPKNLIRGLWFGTLEPRDYYHNEDNYALGYEMKNKSCRPSHKILRFLDTYDMRVNKRLYEFEIYNLDSNSWKILNVTRVGKIPYYQRGVSLKGNTYWFVQSKYPGGGCCCCLLCFDFTTERFGHLDPV